MRQRRLQVLGGDRGRLLGVGLAAVVGGGQDLGGELDAVEQRSGDGSGLGGRVRGRSDARQRQGLST